MKFLTSHLYVIIQDKAKTGNDPKFKKLKMADMPTYGSQSTASAGGLGIIRGKQEDHNGPVSLP